MEQLSESATIDNPAAGELIIGESPVEQPQPQFSSADLYEGLALKGVGGTPESAALDELHDSPDVWGDEFSGEVENHFEEKHRTESVGNELEEEFEDELEADYLSEVSESIDCWETLEAATIEALNAGNATEVYHRLIQAIDHISGSVSSDPHAPRSTSQLAKDLKTLRTLLQRHSDEGFDELDTLEEAADLLAEAAMEEALPILGGLAARVALKPILERAGKRLSPSFRQKMVFGANQAVQTLANSHSLRALPGLSVGLGETAIRHRFPLNAVPKIMRRAAAKVAASPKLKQRLSASATNLVIEAATRRGQKPLKLNIRGPVEISIDTTQ